MELALKRAVKPKWATTLLAKIHTGVVWSGRLRVLELKFVAERVILPMQEAATHRPNVAVHGSIVIAFAYLGYWSRRTGVLARISAAS